MFNYQIEIFKILETLKQPIYDKNENLSIFPTW